MLKNLKQEKTVISPKITVVCVYRHGKRTIKIQKHIFLRNKKNWKSLSSKLFVLKTLKEVVSEESNKLRMHFKQSYNKLNQKVNTFLVF